MGKQTRTSGGIIIFDDDDRTLLFSIIFEKTKWSFVRIRLI